LNDIRHSPPASTQKSQSDKRTGKLSKDLSHLAVNFSHPKKNVIGIEIHHGARKNVAALRTVRTLIQNLIVGVTKGFKYKMRYVYAHFPINVNIDKNSETDLYEVEIRNFIGEKLVRRVVMRPGVDVKVSTAQKDELVLEGNSLEDVSQSAADIQQICKVRNKDIRKVCGPSLLEIHTTEFISC
jgi:large subunit ribosomal protein L9e